MKKVKVIAPATVANVGCGYDTIGFALEGIYEELIISTRDDTQVKISVEGAELPLQPEENVAAIAINALLNHLNVEVGFNLHIKKLFKPGSGLGSSASSAAGAVYGMNKLLGDPLAMDKLLPFALEGEAFASKSYHADNVAPSLLGGFIVVRSYDPLDYFSLPVADLHVLIARPEVVVKTSEAKGLVPKDIPVSVARNQWGNLASLVHALHTKDWSRLKVSIDDFIAEPVRKELIPGYDQAKKIAEKHGCFGFNISGSGPSFFMLFQEIEALNNAKNEIKSHYLNQKIGCTFFESKMSNSGCQIEEK